MDQATLVVESVPDGRRFLERFAADGNPLRAAFWGKESERYSPYLYVVTDLVEVRGQSATYNAVGASLERLDPQPDTPLDIRLIDPGAQLAQDILARLARYKGRGPLRLSDEALGGVSFDWAYVYPPHVYTFAPENPMTTEEIGREIVRLMGRGPGLLGASRVTLRDGTHFSGVPFGLIVSSQKAVEAQFIADGEVAPRVVRLDEINSIA